MNLNIHFIFFPIIANDIKIGNYLFYNGETVLVLEQSKHNKIFLKCKNIRNTKEINITLEHNQELETFEVIEKEFHILDFKENKENFILDFLDDENQILSIKIDKNIDENFINKLKQYDESDVHATCIFYPNKIHEYEIILKSVKLF